jgi:serine-type D-Ala-D-Ala carboxypeptidase/endopeptidase (penicillin-binding protein 4)
MIKHRINFLVIIWIAVTMEVVAQVVKNDQPKPVSSQSIIMDFQKDLEDIFNDPNFANAQWGVVIQSLETGEFLFKKNENKSFMPASNMKIFTTATTLCMLGPNYRYSTRLITNGSIENNVLKGDLIIKGSGDPTFPKKYKNDSLQTLFTSWIDSLKSSGITEIRGDIIGDDNCFDDQGLGVGWSWDDETYWFSAPTSGLSFNDNCVDLAVSPGEYIGSTAQIKLNPNTNYVTLKNNIRTVPPDTSANLDYFRKSGTNVINAFGVIPLNGTTRVESLSIDNPSLYTATVLKEMLEAAGIKITGNAVDIDDVKPKREFTTIYQTLNTSTSLPMSEIIKMVNKRSQNLYAEQILKTLGKELGGVGSVSRAVEIEKKFLSGIGMDPDKLMIVDGSGLSRLDLVTPMQAITLLSYMYRHKYWKEFYNSLPIAGVDGTLENRMKNSKATNNVHAKTGYINYVRSLSGYVTTKDGEMFVFTMMANHYTVPTSLVNNIQDLVCVRLANFSRKQ